MFFCYVNIFLLKNRTNVRIMFLIGECIRW
nr:MAG TPA: hypothetical protein [Caudoviricetes sp.]